MNNKIVFNLLLIAICFIIGVHSRGVTINSTDVITSKISSNCDNCSASDNKVCVDGFCECEPNYRQENGSCVYYQCSAHSGCLILRDHRYCSNGSCVCLPGYFEVAENGGKCTDPSTLNFGCDFCHYSDNKVCMDGQCYCKPGFRQIWDSLHSSHCQFIGCSTRSDCEGSADNSRHCFEGSCVCDEDYIEDWNNGGKCTMPTTRRESCPYSDCPYSENKVCIDDECVCRAGYKKQYSSLESWTCVYQGCSSDRECIDRNRQCSNGQCVCKSGYFEDWINGGKCTQPSSNNLCSDDCYYSDNKVCLDGRCYCQPDYRKEFKSLVSWKCVYEGCSADSDCSVSYDDNRQCSKGSCVCQTNYYDDWNNGRKCTWKDENNNVRLWSLASIILVVPLIAFLFWVCIKYRNRVQPPPYSPTD